MNVISNFSPHAKAPAAAKNQQRSSRKAAKTPRAGFFGHRLTLISTDTASSFPYFLSKIQSAADVLVLENARNGMGAYAVKLERVPK